MIAVECSLKCYARKSHVIRVYIRNTCVVSILKNMGTLHNKKWNKKYLGVVYLEEYLT